MIFCWTKTTILMLIYFPSLSDETVDFKQRIILQIIVAINVSVYIKGGLRSREQWKSRI